MSNTDRRKPQETYETERLILKARALDQAYELFALINRNREHLHPWMPWEETTKAVEDTMLYLKSAMDGWGKRTLFDFSVFDKKSERLIGSFGIHSMKWDRKSCELGYWIGKEHEGNGFISEAVCQGEKIAAELGFHRILIQCDRLNQRSQKIPSRLGYRLESVQVDELLVRGRLRDTMQFVKLVNPEIPGAITENLPAGYSIRDCDEKDFGDLIMPQARKIFDDQSLILRARDLISETEKERLKILNAEHKYPFVYQCAIYYHNEVVGWTWGYQDSRESCYMVNSAIVPEHRGRGLYTRLLEVTLHRLKEKGFQRIWSRHVMTNNAIITAKLKQGFQITGTELSDVFGSLVHLTYYTNPTRRKILEFRSGETRPAPEIKEALKL